MRNNSADYFYKHIKHLEVPDCGNVTVVPLDLLQWIKILEFTHSLGYIHKHELGILLAEIEQEGIHSKNSQSWMDSIPKIINNWMDNLTNLHKV